MFLFQMTLELKRIHDELNQKTSEIQQLQMELHTRDNEETNELMATNLRRVIVTLQNENSNLKVNENRILFLLFLCFGVHKYSKIGKMLYHQPFLHPLFVAD